MFTRPSIAIYCMCIDCVCVSSVKVSFFHAMSDVSFSDTSSSDLDDSPDESFRGFGHGYLFEPEYTEEELAVRA